jgi:hypothetical protein
MESSPQKGAFWLFAVAEMESSPQKGAFWLFAVAKGRFTHQKWLSGWSR